MVLDAHFFNKDIDLEWGVVGERAYGQYDRPRADRWCCGLGLELRGGIGKLRGEREQ